MQERSGEVYMKSICKKILAPIIPEIYPSLKHVVVTTIKQGDYNTCGVWMLTWFTAYVEGRSIRQYSASEMAYMRYQFLGQIVLRHLQFEKIITLDGDDEQVEEGEIPTTASGTDIPNVLHRVRF